MFLYKGIRFTSIRDMVLYALVDDSYARRSVEWQAQMVHFKPSPHHPDYQD